MTLLRSLIASAIAVLMLCSAQAQTVFVTDYYNNSILHVDSVTGTAVPPPVGPVSLPASFAYGPDGFLYSASQGTASVAKINPTTGAVVGSVTFGGQVQVPAGVAFAPNGNMYVADFVDQTSFNTGTVKEFSVNPTTGAATLVRTLAAGLTQPSGLLLNGTNLYITEANTAAVLYTGTPPPPAVGGRLSVVNTALANPTLQPLVTGSAFTGFTGMALSGSTLYYTDLFMGAIDRFDVGTNTALAALVAPGGSLLNQFPNGLYVDSLASILVANLGNHDFSGSPPDPGNGSLRRYSTLDGTQIGPDILQNIYGGEVIGVNPVPEPGTLALVGAAIAGFAAWRRRRSAPSA
jgi:hypothetical protein